MRTYILGRDEALALAAAQGCLYDKLYFGQHGYPAVVAAPDFSGSPRAGVADAAWLFSGAWQSGFAVSNGALACKLTVTPGDSATVSYTGVACQIEFEQGPYGGIFWFVLDGGAPRLAADTYREGGYGLSRVLVTTPEGGQHTVTITWYGDLNGSHPNADTTVGVQTVSPVVNGVGTDMAPFFTINRTYRQNPITDSWTITALSTTTYQIQNAAATLTYGPFTQGTTTLLGPQGLTVVCAAGTFTPGHTATFTTHRGESRVTGAYVAPADTALALWSSPLIDADNHAMPIAFGASVWEGILPIPMLSSVVATETGQAGLAIALPETQPQHLQTTVTWLCAVWEENPAVPITRAQALSGNTLSPTDASWNLLDTSYGMPMAHDPSSAHGYLGMSFLPPARYAQIILHIPPGGYVRNLRLYAWDLDTDPDARLWPPMLWEDPLSNRLFGALTVSAVADLRDPYRELMRSFSLGTAVAEYLDQQGQEWSLGRPFGMTDTQYEQLLRFLSSARSEGLTRDFIVRLLAILAGPGALYGIVIPVGTESQWILGVSQLGIDTILGTISQGFLTAYLLLQVSAMTVPPQIVQQIVEQFRPINVKIIYVWV